MSYGQQRVVAIVLTILVGGITLIQTGNAETLGLSPTMAAWLAVLSGTIGIALGFLPNVRGTDQQPEHIANRIMELNRAERLELLSEIEQRHRAADASETGGV